jgi:hypothetical protein
MGASGMETTDGPVNGASHVIGDHVNVAGIISDTALSRMPPSPQVIINGGLPAEAMGRVTIVTTGLGCTLIVAVMVAEQPMEVAEV